MPYTLSTYVRFLHRGGGRGVIRRLRMGNRACLEYSCWSHLLRIAPATPTKTQASLRKHTNHSFPMATNAVGQVSSSLPLRTMAPLGLSLPRSMVRVVEICHLYALTLLKRPKLPLHGITPAKISTILLLMRHYTCRTSSYLLHIGLHFNSKLPFHYKANTHTHILSHASLDPCLNRPYMLD
jgi:hypothetical protein